MNNETLNHVHAMFIRVHNAAVNDNPELAARMQRAASELMAQMKPVKFTGLRVVGGK